MPASRSTQHPNHVRLDLPLIRSRDRLEVGTLTLIRNYSWRFYDDDGHRFAVPQLADVVTISLTGPDGDLVSWREIPAAALLCPQDEQDQDGERRAGEDASQERVPD